MAEYDHHRSVRLLRNLFEFMKQHETVVQRRRDQANHRLATEVMRLKQVAVTGMPNRKH